MSGEKNNVNGKKIEFKTYCSFSKGKLDIEDAIGVIFKDYIKKLENKK